MLVHLNTSKEIADYYRGYNLDEVVDTLLEMFDFTCLPPTSGVREVELKCNVSNPAFISLYNTFGARSKKVSLGRLLEFGYNMEVLSMEKFKLFKVPEEEVDSPLPKLYGKAYNALITAQHYDKSLVLTVLTDLLRLHMNGCSQKDIVATINNVLKGAIDNECSTDARCTNEAVSRLTEMGESS